MNLDKSFNSIHPNSAWRSTLPKWKKKKTRETFSQNPFYLYWSMLHVPLSLIFRGVETMLSICMHVRCRYTEQTPYRATPTSATCYLQYHWLYVTAAACGITSGQCLLGGSSKLSPCLRPVPLIPNDTALLTVVVYHSTNRIDRQTRDDDVDDDHEHFFLRGEVMIVR